jgi:hypothetical protein
MLKGKMDSYMIDLFADISNFLFRHREEDICLRDYIKPYLVGDNMFTDLDIHDMKPFMELTRQKIRNEYQRLFELVHLKPSNMVLKTKR